ncbi:MAG: Ig domain-containing protein, partial [Fidelibacterota bacterium]
QDGLSEFLALEKTEDHQTRPHAVTYYEIGPDGTHLEVWTFATGRPVADARIANTDGNTAPEVVVMEVPHPGTLVDDGPWLHVFPWNDGTFASEPEFQWGNQRPDEPQSLRPSHFAVLDIESDGRDEIAVSLASPRRELVLLTRTGPDANPGFTTLKLPLSERLASGYGHILLAAGDHNQDGYPDLLALNKELDRLKMQLFEGTGSALKPGSVYDRSTEELDLSLRDILPSGLHSLDTDRDGREELMVPFRSGRALAISLDNQRLHPRPVETELSALFVFPPSGLEPSHLNDVLLTRAELGVTGRRVRQLKMEAVAAPEPEEPAEEAVTPPASSARKVKRLELEAIPTKAETAEGAEKPAEETATAPDTGGPAVQPLEETAEPSAPRRVRKLALESVTREELSEPPAPTKIEVPPGIEISDTVRVGQTFRHPLKLGEGEKLHAFRPTSLPGGASFDPASLAITWTPTVAQVGLHTLSYDVEYELTGDVRVEETGETVQLVTKTETRTVQRYIIVLDEQAE